MLRTTLFLTSVLAVSACATRATAPAPEPATPATITALEKELGPDLKVAFEDDQADQGKKGVTGRKVGDFHVYQYSGSALKQPATLTEQVVGMKGQALVVDFVLEQGGDMSGLRVLMDSEDRILSVARITADGEAPATLADYDAMMARTQLVPDSNDRTLTSDHTSCMVGDESVDCDVTVYRVTLGGKNAKLSVTTSDKLPGRDVGGDIVSEDGKVLYSARLVERGNQPPAIDAFAKRE